jgi:dihydropyrimidinase
MASTGFAEYCCGYGIHQNFTTFNEQTLAEIPLLPELGVTSIKMFTAYNGRMRLRDDEIFQAMRIAKQEGIISLIHAENGDLIDLLVKEALESGHTEPIWHARTRPAWGAVESVYGQVRFRFRQVLLRCILFI